MVDHESRSTAAVGEVGQTEDGDGDVATFAVDEADAADQDGRRARCCITDTRAQHASQNTATGMNSLPLYMS